MTSIFGLLAVHYLLICHFVRTAISEDPRSVVASRYPKS